MTNDIRATISQVTTQELCARKATNAPSPLRAVEAIANLVAPAGQVAVMSSELGSIAENADGGWEVAG